MDVWLSLPFLPPDGLRALTLAAEEVGIAGLALSDHVCVPVEFSSPYPFGGGKASLPPETLLPDPLVAIAALAAMTTRVRFMTSVLIAPLRHPVALAKEAATVAGMSDGRFDLGLGVGWLREEFEAMGRTDFDERGQVFDEMLPLLRQLWTGAPVAHDGHHFRFDAVAVNPTPPAPIPLFLGGVTNVALRRCAAVADGWIGANHTVEELPEVLRRLDEERAKAGTDDRPFEVRSGLKGTVTPERIAAFRQMGVDSFLLAPWQIGERRESIHDIPVEAIIDALPSLVASIQAS